MYRWLIVCLLAAATVTAARADGESNAVYPPLQDSGSAQAVPYPYAQTQDSYDALAQQQTGYGADPYTAGQPAGYPGFALAAVKAEAAAIALKAVIWVVSHVAALAIGSLIALGICKLTPLCSYVAHRWYRSELPSTEEVRAFAKPAMSILKAAMKKYGPLNA